MKRTSSGRRWLTPSSLAIIAVLVLIGSTTAGGWCRADPRVDMDVEEVQIWVAIPEEFEPAVTRSR